MIFNDINFLSILSNHSGFGINTDVIETNILNLSVVIGVLVYYGRIVLSDSLKSRKETILRSLQEAENKFKEAEENLNFAKENFEAAKVKAEQIKQQGFSLSEKTFKTLLDAVEEDIKRLKALNLATIKMEEEKSINEICQKLSQVALIKAIEKISAKLNANLQKKIISRKIEKLSIKTLG